MSASQFPPLASKVSTRHCTNCSSLMSIYTLPGHYNQTLEIDVCHDCNAIWFDQWESTQLSPDGTVALFQLINERGGASSAVASKFGEGLRVQQIKCSGCGASVNIGKTDACEYCRAPVSVFDRDAAKAAIDHYLSERQKTPSRQAPGTAPPYGHASTGSSNFEYHSVDIATDILFALGRVALRGFGSGASRALPAAVGAGAGSVLADTGSSATGGLLDSLQTGSAVGLPSATDALFGAGLGNGIGGGISSSVGNYGLVDSLGDALSSANLILPDATGALPSATEALFGGGSGLVNSAGDAAGGFMGELGNLFSSTASSGIVDSAGNVLSDLGGSAIESVGSGALDVASDVASSAGDGLIDLVSDGLGSLLGSLFD